MSNEGGMGFWDVAKIVLLTAGAIYLVSLVTWLAHWGVIAVAVGGVGYLAWQVSAAFNGNETKPKLLTAETPFDQRLKQLQHEERELDRQIGL